VANRRRGKRPGGVVGRRFLAATPCQEAAYDDYLDRLQIVDDAQPYEIEVARLALTEPGYCLSVEWDGEQLDSGDDDKDDEERDEDGEEGNIR
jgi:hypothetical protein